MTIPEKLPHKVSQIRHDLDDLYELVSRVEKGQTRTIGILQRHNNRFEELQQTLDLQGGRLDGVEGRLDGVGGRLDGVEGRLDGVEGRLDRIEDNQRRQFEQLSGQLAEILGALRGPAAAGPESDSER